MDDNIPNISGEINSVDNSIKSLIDFIDKRVIKYFDEFLEKLESAYLVYSSEVADKKIQPTPGEFKKVKMKYNKLNDSMHRFLNSITQDYMNLLQIGYKIKSLYEMLNHCLNQVDDLKRKNNVNELDVVTDQVSHITNELDQLIAYYNQEISKLNFLQLNFKNKMIIYQSPSAGKTFSISLKVFNQQFDSLIESNKSPNKEQIVGKLLQQFPEQLQSISKEPPLELLAVRSVKPQILKQPQASVSNEIIDVTYSLLEPYTQKVINPAFKEYRFIESDDVESMESQEDEEEYISEDEVEEMKMKAKEIKLKEEEEEMEVKVEETKPEEKREEMEMKVEESKPEEEKEEKIGEGSTTTPSSLEKPIDTEMSTTSRDYEEQPLRKIDIPEISIRQEYQKQHGDLLEGINLDERIPEEIAIDNHLQITYEFFLDTLESLDRQIDELKNREYELIPRTKNLRISINDFKELLEITQSQMEIYRYQNELQMILKSLIQLSEDDETIQQSKYKLFEVKEKLFKKWQNELERNAQMLTTESDRVMEYEEQSGSPLEKLEKDRDQLIRMVDSLKNEVDHTIDSYTERKEENMSLREKLHYLEKLIMYKMHANSKVNPSEKSKLNENGVVAINKSINSLINFLEKLLKCIHDTLDQLENYYQTYMSAVQSGWNWNVGEKTSHDQKKIDLKYNYIKNQLEDFMTCIVKDYAEFMESGYEIKTLHENYDFYINYLQKISHDDKKYDELNALIPKAEQIKKKINKLVIQYNSEITKLSYLKLNLQYKVIVYQSSFTGQSFSIPINILIRNFKNLIQFNKLVVIGNIPHTTFLEQPLSNIENLSREHELIYAQSVNLDPLINITGEESIQLSSAKTSRQEFPPEEPSRPNLSNIENVSLKSELIYARSVNLDPLINITEEENSQPSSAKTSRQESSPEEPSRSKYSRKESSRIEPPRHKFSQEFTQQEPSKRKRPRQKPSQEVSLQETLIGGVTTPVAEAESLETAQPSEGSTTPAVPMSTDLSLTAVRKRKPNLTTSEDAESQSLEVDKSDESKIKKKPRGSSDETKSTVESEIDVTTTEGVPEDTPSMPSLRDELLEAERLSSLSSSSSQIQPQSRKHILKQKFKRRLEQTQKKSSLKVPMKVKKPTSKIRYVSTKPIPESVAINKQKIITKEFYDKIFEKLKSNINKIKVWENEKIIEKNNDLCKMYHIIQEKLNNRKKDLEETEREIGEMRKSETESEKVQENLKMKEDKIEKLKIIIIHDESEIRNIKYKVRILDKKDYELQIYKNILYNIQSHLCQRWLEQLNKNLALETDDKKRQEFRIDIYKVEKEIRNIFSKIRELHQFYVLRKRRRITSGPYKERRLGLVDDPLAEKKEEPVGKIIPNSMPTNLLIPKRKLQ